MTVRHIVISLSAFAAFQLIAPPVQAAIIEIGDLNIIDDAGNPSDGLRYLDMSYSDNRTLADALTNAQLVYSNARVATPGEFNDLFAAAGISYNSIGVLASDAFAAGSDKFVLSSGSNYDGGVLQQQLGSTAGQDTIIFTDPDGSNDPLTTRDFLRLEGTQEANTRNIATSPPDLSVGWLLVSEAESTVVPEPSSLAMLVTAGLVLVSAGVRRRKRLRDVPSADQNHS